MAGRFVSTKWSAHLAMVLSVVVAVVVVVVVVVVLGVVAGLWGLPAQVTGHETEAPVLTRRRRRRRRRRAGVVSAGAGSVPIGCYRVVPSFFSRIFVPSGRQKPVPFSSGGQFPHSLSLSHSLLFVFFEYLDVDVGAQQATPGRRGNKLGPGKKKRTRNW